MSSFSSFFFSERVYIRQELWVPLWFNKEASQVMLVIKNSPANAGDTRDTGHPWVGKILWRRKWQPTQVLLPEKSQGYRSLVGYSPGRHKESDMNE